MLTSGGTATVGSVQQDGVRYDSNSMSTEDMQSLLEQSDAPAADPAPPAEPAEPEPTADPAPSEPAPKEAAADKAAKAKKNPQERFDKLTYEREEAKREAARERQAREETERRYTSEFQSLRAELEALKRPAPKADPKTDPAVDAEPKLEDFAHEADPYAAWMRASARYDARQEFQAQQEKARAAYEQRQQAQRQAEHQHHEHQRLHAWSQRMEQAFATTPDLRATVEQMPILPRPMMDVIIDSEIPDQILGHLLAHPEEQQRIAQLSPLHQFRAVSRIEYALEKAAALVTGSAPQEKPKTSAHPPVSPVSGSHAAPKSSGEPGPDASYEEHKAYWDAREAEERRSRRR